MSESEGNHEPVANSEAPETSSLPAKPKKNVHNPVTIGFCFFTFMFFVSFVFNITAISIGMMDSRTSDACISIWGPKPKCYGSHFQPWEWDDYKGTGEKCEKGNSLIEAAQAFSIMCVIGAFLSLGVCALQLIGFADFAVVAAIMTSISTVGTLVVWSTMLAMYWANLCGQGVYADDYKIGVGLILYITSWCCQMTGLMVLILDIYLGNSR